jgi:hypothetical protein
MNNYPEGVTDASLERRFGGPGLDRVAEGRWEHLLAEVAGEVGAGVARDLFRDELLDDACLAVIRLAAQNLMAPSKVTPEVIGTVAVGMVSEALKREHGRRMESVCVEDDLARDRRHD